MKGKRPAADPFIIVDVTAQTVPAETRKRIRSNAAKHSHESVRHNRSQSAGSPSTLASLSTTPSNLSSRSTATGTPVTPFTAFVTFTCKDAEDEAARQETVQPIRCDQSPLPLDVVNKQRNKPRLGLQVCSKPAYPVPEQHFYARTIHFMWRWIINAWKVLEVSEVEREEALVFVQRLTMTDPAYFFMNMLSCSTTLVQQGVMSGRVLPWLMAQTVKAINVALQDPNLMLGVGVVLTVGRIALWECMRGNVDICTHVHRPAQVRMLAMSGGLESLSVPRVVKEHILWGDRLIQRRTGQSLADIDARALKTAQHSSSLDDTMLRAYFLDSTRSDGADSRQ